jgi:hypothetical protein
MRGASRQGRTIILELNAATDRPLLLAERFCALLLKGLVTYSSRLQSWQSDLDLHADLHDLLRGDVEMGS